VASEARSTIRTATDPIGSIPSVFGRLGRRLIPSATVLVAWLILRSLRNRSIANLQNEAFVTGYSLAAICIFLMLLGVRKRVLSAFTGRLAIWQQAHHYLGLLSIGAYALHTNILTTGWLETALALSFWSIALTGIIAWYVNRTGPRLLRAAGAQILRNDIPTRAKFIAKQAHELALEAAGKKDSAVLADHYRNYLSSFFASRRGLMYRLSPSGNKRRRLLSELENVDRYLNDAGGLLRLKMSSLVQAKDDLDFQSAIQNRIRFWASAHTWILGSFVVLTVAHVFVVHRFTSSW
jgi:hypothetical protein